MHAQVFLSESAPMYAHSGFPSWKCPNAMPTVVLLSDMAEMLCPQWFSLADLPNCYAHCGFPYRKGPNAMPTVVFISESIQMVCALWFSLAKVPKCDAHNCFSKRKCQNDMPTVGWCGLIWADLGSILGSAKIRIWVQDFLENSQVGCKNMKNENRQAYAFARKSVNK